MVHVVQRTFPYIRIDILRAHLGGWHSAKLALPSAAYRHSAKLSLRRVPALHHSAKLTSVNRPLGRLTAGARAGHVRPLCRVLSQRHSAKINNAEGPFFADGRNSAKVGHAECRVFAECGSLGTRQRSALPSARVRALGKAGGTRQL